MRKTILILVYLLGIIACRQPEPPLISPVKNTNKTEPIVNKPGLIPTPDKPIPKPKKTFDKKSEFDFSFEFNKIDKVVRFKKGDQVLTRKQFIDYLAGSDANSSHLQSLVNTFVGELGSTDIKLKSPPIGAATLNQPFFWLVQDQRFSSYLQSTYRNYLVHCDVPLLDGSKNSEDYEDRFLAIVDKNGEHNKATLDNQNFKNAAVYLINLGSPPDLLVIPCPIADAIDNTQNNVLLNIGSYARYLEENKNNSDAKERMQSYWRAVGLAAQYSLTHNNRDIYLHTHGTGTYYLHFRVDVFNYDYKNEASELINEAGATTFYQRVFSE